LVPTGRCARATCATAFGSAAQGFHPRGYPIGPLKRFWTLETQRIILATALMRQLRKRTNAQRLGLIYLQSRRSTY
jgi:hypothetical protein